MILKLLDVLLVVGGPFLSLGLKLVPLLYQWKLIKTEEQVKEQQRRFQEAIRQAEEKAKDPDNIKKQYDSAKEAAKKKWKESQGQAEPVLAGTPAISAPEEVRAYTPFMVSVSGFSGQTILYVDKQWALGVIKPDTPKEVLLNTAGSRTLDLKIGETWVSKPISVKEKV